jgi:hypothetical protein
MMKHSYKDVFGKVRELIARNLPFMTVNNGSILGVDCVGQNAARSRPPALYGYRPTAAFHGAV